MQEARIIVVLILITFALITTAQSAMPFKCGSGPGPQNCGCSGASDCQDMRKSGMCSGPLDCHTGSQGLVCTCAEVKTGPGTTQRPPTSAGTKQ
jgi:hypothetical protein